MSDRIGELFSELVREVAKVFAEEARRTSGARASDAPATSPMAQLLSPREAALLLGKSTDWVRKRASDGTLPHRRIGKSLRFVRTEIEKWVERGNP